MLLHVLISVAIILVVLIIFATLLLNSYKHKAASSGKISPLGMCGVAETNIAPEGAVVVNGEVWRACARQGATLERGTTVRVVGVRGLLLEVEAESEPPTLLND